MAIPICGCKVKYQLSDAHWPAVVEHCAFHAAAGEMFEVLDAIMGQTEQAVHHRACHCLACRGIKVLFKARSKHAPEVPAIERKQAASASGGK